MNSIFNAFRHRGTSALFEYLSPLGLALFFAGLFILLSDRSAMADECTGLSTDDPKDLDPAASVHVTTREVRSEFVPLPRWSTYRAMPPLPDKLKPLGKKEKVVAITDSHASTATAATPPTLAPPVEIPVPPKAPTPTEISPTLIAVSPFLQWIKDHPKDATAEAQRQANTYRAASGPANPAEASGAADPYWMPPLSDAGVQATSGSSAAIYSTPQRN